MAVDLNKYNTPVKKGVDLNKYNMPGTPADSPEAQQYAPVNRLKSQNVTSKPEGSDFFNKMGLQLAAGGERLKETGQDLLTALLSGGPMAGGMARAKIDAYNRPSPVQNLAQGMREIQSVPENLASDVIANAPYFAPYIGQALFGADVARNPEMFPEMGQASFETIKRLAKIRSMLGSGNLNEEGLKALKEEIDAAKFSPGGELFNATLPIMVALGIKGAVKGKPAEAIRPTEIPPQILESTIPEPIVPRGTKYQQISPERYISEESYNLGKQVKDALPYGESVGFLPSKLQIRQAADKLGISESTAQRAYLDYKLSEARFNTYKQPSPIDMQRYRNMIAESDRATGLVQEKIAERSPVTTGKVIGGRIAQKAQKPTEITQNVSREKQPSKIVIGGEGKKIREFMEQKKAAKPKEPWEMTREDWEHKRESLLRRADELSKIDWAMTYRPGKEAPYSIPGFGPKYSPANKPEIFKIESELRSINAYGKPNGHIESVRQALREGKPVPPEVLVDYPDLIQKVGKPAQAPTEPAPLEPPKGSVETEPTIRESRIVPPEPPKAEPPATVPPKPPTKPVGMTPAPEGTIGLKKDIIADVRESIGLNQLEEPMRKRFGQSLEEARNTKLTESALDIAKEVKESKRPIDDVEHSAMTIKAAELANEYQAAQKTISELIEKGDRAAANKETNRANAIADNLDLLTEASDYAGTEIARALSIRRMLVNKETFDLASIVQRARARKGKPLTESEMKKANELAVRFEETNKKLKELEDKYNAELSNREKIIAERIAKIEAGKARITIRAEASRAKIKAERESLYKQLESMGYTLRSAGLSADEVYILGKIAVTYAKEGMVNISEIAQQIRIKIPEFTDRDVIQALAARDPKKQARARLEATRRIGLVKQQARLMLKIEEAEKNLFAPKKRPATTPEIRNLQKTLRETRANAYRTVSDANRLDRIINRINEVQDQLANQYRDVRKQRKTDPAQIEQAKKQLAELRKEMRIQDELADLENQMRTGEFKIPETKPARELPPDLERQQIELKRVKREARQMIDDMAPTTPRKVFGETINTLRTLKATADMSGVLRQGAILTVAYPGKVPRAFGQTLKATFSRYKAEQIDNAIRSDPVHYLRERAGLELTELGVSKITRREEMFGSRLLERIPVLKTVIGASERNMTTYLNLMRTGVFDDFMKKFPNASQAELKAMANWINVTTGRGNLGRYASIANELSLAFFAPKFAVSRVQTPYKVFQYWRMPRVRNQIAKDMVATVGTGIALLGLAKLAGFDVGTDPRNADWGKIRVGDSRIDIWAGHQQPMRVIAKIGIGVTDRIGITGKDLTDYEKDFDPLDLIFRFMSYKLGPGFTTGKELLTGRDMVGEKVTLSETAINQVVPMWIQDVRDAAKSDGWGQSAFAGGLTFMGIGVSTYGDNEKTTREKAKKLISSGKNDEAVALIKKWNTENPNNKIVKLK